MYDGEPYKPSPPVATMLIQFARNGRWGTCGFCPRVEGIGVLPELCAHTDRYDHNLNALDFNTTIAHDKERFEARRIAHRRTVTGMR